MLRRIFPAFKCAINRINIAKIVRVYEKIEPIKKRIEPAKKSRKTGR